MSFMKLNILNNCDIMAKAENKKVLKNKANLNNVDFYISLFL